MSYVSAQSILKWGSKADTASCKALTAQKASVDAVIQGGYETIGGGKSTLMKSMARVTKPRLDAQIPRCPEMDPPKRNYLVGMFLGH